MASCTTAGEGGEKVQGAAGGWGWLDWWNAAIASIKSECLTKILSIPLTFIKSNLLNLQGILSILLPSLHPRYLSYRRNGESPSLNDPGD